MSNGDFCDPCLSQSTTGPKGDLIDLTVSRQLLKEDLTKL